MSATKTFKIGLSATDKQNMAQDVYERVLALTFAEYDSGETYNTGDFVVYSDTLYQCLADNVTGAWDSTKWQQATLQDLLDDIESAVDSVNGKADILSLENGTLVVAKAQTAKQIENINDEVGSTQTAPFNFQATGTDNNTTETPTAPIAKQLELRGNSVAFNQLVELRETRTIWGVTVTNNANGSITVTGIPEKTGALGVITLTNVQMISGHKYLLKGFGSGAQCNFAWNNITITQDSYIINANQSGSYGVYLNALDTITNINITIYPQIFDLTQLGKEYSSVVEFNRDYPLPYYEYNAGTLVSCKTNKLITIGCNAFDGVWEIGSFDNPSATDNCHAKNFIRVIAGETYAIQTGSLSSVNLDAIYFIFYDINNNEVSRQTKYSVLGSTTIVIPDNACYLKFRFYKASYNFTNNFPTEVMFRLFWDESHDYVDYEKHEYDLPNVELRSAGDVYDSITPDGTHTTRVGTIIDLSSLEFVTDQEGTNTYRFKALLNVSKSSGKGISNRFKFVTSNLSNNDEELIGLLNGYLYLRIEKSKLSNTYTATALHTWLTNNITQVNYELETPTTEQVSEFPENVVVDDFGTMEFVSSLSAPIVPQGNKFFYPADYVLFIDDMYNRSKDGGDDADATNFVVQSELSALDTKYGTRIPALPSDSANGNYTLKATMSDGTITYSWVAD